MTLSVDLFYSFRSPFSYLALPTTLKLVAEFDLAVKLASTSCSGACRARA
jgi:2-hydroxychromene-2-carboxylate isomerase